MLESRQFKEDERRYFDDHLNEYLQRFCQGRWLAYKQFVERRVRPLLDRREVLRILDLGCGPMPAFASLTGRHAYICTDLAERPLRYLVSRFPTCRCILADAESLPFAPRAFDLVISFGLLHHLPNPRQAVREMRRVLRPGGIVVASEPSEHWSTQTASPNEIASPHERGFSYLELRELFEGMALGVWTFNHSLAERGVTRLVRALRGWERGAAALWAALFIGERLLHRMGVRGADFLVVARDLP